MVLTHKQARAFYDHFGSKQDTQGFYEDKALKDLIAHADFAQAQRVFELGCGTGRFALELLQHHLNVTASYLGIDVSKTMITLAQQRLAAYGERAKVLQTEGALTFAIPDHSVDRVVSTYVLDLLSEADIVTALSEARRVLTPHGKLCLVSLTQGVSVASRLVCKLWSAVFHLRASLVGGCRPIRLAALIDLRQWTVEYHHVISQFGVPSEILIASPTSAE